MNRAVRRWTLLVAWLGALVLLGAWSVLNLRPSTDLSQFLPRGVSQQDQVLLSQVRSGVAARTLLLRISAINATLNSEALADASRALAERLREEDAFLEIANGDLTAAAAGTDPVLFQYRYLVGPPAHCADALNASTLRDALEQRLDELASGLAMLDKQRLPEDPTACYRQILLSMAPDQRPSRRHGVWFSPDGQSALLVALTSANASDIAAQRRAISAIEDAFGSLPEHSALRLELAGPGYFAVSSEQQIKTETLLLSTAASLIVALILALAFRSAALVALGILPLASGILVGALLVSLLYGSVHGITLALGVTLLGVALDYPVHVYAHTAGTDATGRRAVWRTLLLGMATTVLGYAALAWTSFQGLSQLGVLAAAGLATAALTSRYLLPRLLPAGYQLPERPWLTSLQSRLPRLSRRSGTILLLASSLVLGLALSVQDNPWETDIRRLSVIPQSQLDKDSAIRAELGAPDVARLLYLIEENQAALLERLEAARPDLEGLAMRGLIGGFDSVDRWLPSPGIQQARQDQLPTQDKLTAALASANTELPFRLERFQPFIDAVQASHSLPPLRVEDLADGLIGTRTGMLLTAFGERWLGLVPLSGVVEGAGVDALNDIAERHGMTYLDLRDGTAKLLSDFFTEVLEKLLIAAAILLVTLALALRNSSRLAQILLPMTIALVISFLLVLLVHGSANLFHLVSLLLVAGLAIDYSLFLSRPTATAADRQRSLFSVSVGAGSSFAMFAMLSLSAIPALNAIGFTVAAGILCAYFFSLLLARAAPDSLQWPQASPLLGSDTPMHRDYAD
ncbi:MAG: MMPL family transporter [Lamprobacter sp.]|uniref:MMPL family transporter n=1 Tax=Lamprobacter sp. TaxID=3100796 RepID=UPI002B256621|nr:MMPL family transporter [Lamprobacter sp.]MEA3640598.1 MMPL family transporter [Lamprobacter sp.]